MAECTIVVSSCDKYEQLWQPFFTLFFKYWENCPYEVILNTERKQYSDKRVRSVNSSSENVKWGERLLQVLNNIDTDYVIILLDDNFLVSKVNQDKINKCIDWLDKDETAGAFYFMGQEEQLGQANLALGKTSRYEGFRKQDERSWKCLCSPAIWRRKTLIKFIRKHESPWGFEAWGSKRAKRYKDIVYYESFCDNLIYEHAISKPDEPVTSAVVHGKWVLSVVDELFKSNGIQVDYSIMGCMTGEEYQNISMINIIRKCTPKEFIGKCIGVIKSLV